MFQKIQTNPKRIKQCVPRCTDVIQSKTYSLIQTHFHVPNSIPHITLCIIVTWLTNMTIFVSVECNPGFEDEPGLPEVCVPCDRGYYKPDSGVQACTPCSNGFVTESNGATAEAQCNYGTQIIEKINKERKLRKALDQHYSWCPLFSAALVSLSILLIVLFLKTHVIVVG